MNKKEKAAFDRGFKSAQNHIQARNTKVWAIDRAQEALSGTGMVYDPKNVIKYAEKLLAFTLSSASRSSKPKSLKSQ